MIELPEQYGYKSKHIEQAEIDRFAPVLGTQSYRKTIQRGENAVCCYQITHHAGEANPYRFETAYFVGVDWIVENKLPIYVKPKSDTEDIEIDYLSMLFDALKEPENHPHLDSLCEINFEKPFISIPQQQDLLTPLLLIQYINLLKKIVQKGLKKSYYPVTKNLNAKVKGKILIHETLKKNHSNSKILYNYCQYTEFGINSIENQILKKALAFSVAAFQHLKGVDSSHLGSTISYIQPAFQQVDSDVRIDELKGIKPNKLYQEYEQALKLATYILKRYGYNISKVSAEKVDTPPFWIDMSKLFELYVYAKLREQFPARGEVTYHKTFNRLEPDFIVKSTDGQFMMVVDAKYKPRYENSSISVEDIRQVSGYARLKKVYQFLGLEESSVIDCLVIYSSQDSSVQDFRKENFRLKKEEEYNRFYKIGIKLPTKH